ncbi:cytochrome P450 89A2-like [Lolium perenne]|uniref:cytochrome P450 89A2-like n=1 Tax=Lolium perenne TaxID=4522 RepID=UPI0021EA79CA|nr:cytochrome P450 89A2-like [Lolium perenne]
MELLVLTALLLLGLWAVMIRRSRYTSQHAGAAAPFFVEKIGDPAVAHRVLVEDADAFANRPVLPFFVALSNARGAERSENVSSVPYGPHWRALRCNMTAETLHPSRLGLGHLAPLQREAIQNLVAALSAGAKGTVVVRNYLYVAVFRVIARLCFGGGVDERQVSAMQCLVHDFQLGIGEIKPVPVSSPLAKLAQWRQQRQLLAIYGRMSELLLPLIAARRRQPCDDGGRRPYLDSLIQLPVPGPEPEGKGSGRRALTEDEMVNLVLEFLGAGTGSLVVCLEWTLANLVALPDVQKELRREVDAEAATVSPDRSQLIRGMPYLHAVVLESLPMHPPVPLAFRHVQTDAAGMSVGSAAVPGNSDLIVQFLLGDMGRDRKTWTDPDEFRPERFLAGGEAHGIGPLPGPKEMRMMPFGAGHRFCPGVGLTMVVVKCFLAALVREFEWAAPTDAVDFTELDAFFKTMKKPLSARITPRN